MPARVYLAQVSRSRENRAFPNHSRELHDYISYLLNIQLFVSMRRLDFRLKKKKFLISSRAESARIPRACVPPVKLTR